MLINFLKSNKNRKIFTKPTKNFQSSCEKFTTSRLEIDKTVDFFKVAWYNTKRV